MPTRLSYRPQHDREGLDPDGYENLEFYGDFLDEDELNQMYRIILQERKKEGRGLPIDHGGDEQRQEGHD